MHRIHSEVEVVLNFILSSVILLEQDVLSQSPSLRAVRGMVGESIAACRRVPRLQYTGPTFSKSLIDKNNAEAGLEECPELVESVPPTPFFEC